MLCRRSESSLVALAPAKLNLFLRVAGKRPDGFHDIETVMAAVDLYDTLIFSPSTASRIELSVSLAGSLAADVPQPPIPTGPENLITRAALLLKEWASVSHGARIHLIKRIPSEAGLGGGSSDAAATLGTLNILWNIRATRQELCDLAAQLGSDIPFFAGQAPLAICRGRGELLEFSTVRPSLVAVLAKPATGLSTAAVYRNCRPASAASDLQQLMDALHTGRGDQVARYLRNDLQSPAMSLNSEVVDLSNRFASEPVWGHQLSGSGSAYFGLCATRRQAHAVAGRLRSQGIPWVCVVQTRC